METLSTIKGTKERLFNLKKERKTIGFVPTMGALHEGHVSLIQKAKNENDISIASIFVNPLQFNDKNDLEKYPRTLEQDIEKLKSTHCDLLFAPSVEEMYPPHPQPFSQGEGSKVLSFGEDLGEVIDLGTLDKVMEGEHRPGHFQGVCVVVKKLFDIIEPDKAYFGEKDFQQVAVIKYMVKTFGLPVEIIACPTMRETNGLAMSSRNARLTDDERKNASTIYKVLVEAKEKRKNISISELKKWVEEKINENPFLRLEYFEIVNAETLEPITDNRSPITNLRTCIAVKVGAVRLIDNIAF